jgi:uncharacterized protein YjbJ (UPF0337 family)
MANQAKGKVREMAGKVTRSQRLQAEGKVQKTAGKVQKRVGDFEADLEEED